MKKSLRFLLILSLVSSSVSKRGRLGHSTHRRLPRSFFCLDNSFKCLNSTDCIFREYLCDGIEDCDNGSDEWDEECTDYNDGENWDIKIGDKDDESSEEEGEDDLGGSRIPCAKDTYPNVCNCTYVEFQNGHNATNRSDEHPNDNSPYAIHIDCSDRNLTAVPQNIPDNTTEIDLSQNSIETIGKADFAGLFMVKNLLLSKNSIREIEEGSFDDLRDLLILSLDRNKLTSLPASVFETVTNLRELSLELNDISNIPDTVFQNLGHLEELDLSGNEIRLLGKNLLRNQVTLKKLQINWNRPMEIEFGAFDNTVNLNTLRLIDNGISHIRSGIFRNLNKLTKLDLERNFILSIKKYDLQGLHNLSSLQLRNNSLTRIEAGAFDHTVKLKQLRLSLNTLPAIKKDVFEPLQELKILDLSHNKIEDIESGSLSNATRLSHLLLASNKLSILRNGMFTSLSSVTNLDLLDNEIRSLEPGCFDDMLSLYTLDLRENPFTLLPRGLFDNLLSFEWIYFDHFSLCGYAPTVRHCSPRGDGISSIENLLDNMVLRIMVWVVATLAFIGNIFVLIVRCVLKEDNRVHSFFIVNLSFADLLMGLYLFIIAVHDVIYRGEYIKFDLSWRTSWICKLCGFLSFVSSEASVLILTVITLDRLFSIVYPFKFKNRTIKLAFLIMATMWSICIFLAVLPLIDHLEYFSVFFYGGNGVCLPLHIDEPMTNGWEYSLFIFTFINLVAFLFIAFAYAAMFNAIRQSRTNIRSTTENQDYMLAKRFTLIVATDFVCWMPIIILKLVALAGVKVNGDIYAWMAVFILPVNSALNPILYTMTTKLFKQKMLRALGVHLRDKADESLTASKTTGMRVSTFGQRSRSTTSTNGKARNGSFHYKTTNSTVMSLSITRAQTCRASPSHCPSKQNTYVELSNIIERPRRCDFA
ncbi:relaxin receptor 2-like [Ptychodera flava]|uniref:relaxin receptor 2-like n=1 Tax=Ptychodera flava TaxID=63121 RepID=UPI003969FF96